MGALLIVGWKDIFFHKFLFGLDGGHMGTMRFLGIIN